MGDAVGFNPRKPWFNSPDIPPINSDSSPSPYGDGTWFARVRTGSALPPGLSLDANTGLVYGTLTGTGPCPASSSTSTASARYTAS